jgi:hypothetical protein
MSNYTISQAIFNVRTELKKIADDSYYTNRYIFYKLKEVRNILLKREGDKQKLLQSNAVQVINCINMIQTDLGECCGLLGIKGYQINRSEYKIPALLDSVLSKRYLKLYNLNSSKIYDYQDPEVIHQKKKMRFRHPSQGYFIENNYLYFEGNAEKVKLLGIFENPEQIEIFNQCEKDKCSSDNNCTFVPMMQREFSVPGYLQFAMEQMATELILKTSSVGAQDKQNDAKDNSIN